MPCRLGHVQLETENVVFLEQQAIAVLDFDFASPGRRVWDLAMAARMWIPLRPRPDDDPRDATARARRLGRLVAGHGLARADHERSAEPMA